MKKSKVVRLVLLGGAGMALVSCDQSPPADARFFANAEECARVYDQQTCERAFAESKAEFVAEAPKFSRKEECEAEFGVGNCETASSGGGIGSFFLPMMMGYMLGNAFNRPVYRGPDNTALVRSGNQTYKVGNFGSGGYNARYQPGPAAPVQRGGFGSTASSYRGTAGS
jgi:Predicted integral membrane protein